VVRAHIDPAIDPAEDGQRFWMYYGNEEAMEASTWRCWCTWPLTPVGTAIRAEASDRCRDTLVTPDLADDNRKQYRCLRHIEPKTRLQIAGIDYIR